MQAGLCSGSLEMEVGGSLRKVSSLCCSGVTSLETWDWQPQRDVEGGEQKVQQQKSLADTLVTIRL